MKTLFDGIQNVSETEVVNELAELATANTDTYINVLLYNIKRSIIAFLALFLPGLEEKSDSLKPDSVQHRYINKQIEYSERSMSALTDEYRLLLKKAVRGNDAQSDDELLAKVTKKASRILGKKEIEGKSLYEINDLLFRKYPNLAKPDFDDLLLGAIIGEALLVIALFAIVVYWSLPLVLFIGIFVGFQPLIYYGIKNRLSTWKLARFVWLAASGAGGFNESKGKLPLDIITKKTRDNMLLEVRTIHTLCKSVNNLAAEKDAISKSIAGIENQISANYKIIDKVSSNKQKSDAIRIREDKKLENASLIEEKTSLQQSLENKSHDLEKYQKLLSVIETDVANTIIGMWKKLFSQAEFSQDFVFDLIRKFSLEDFSLVEKRIFELCNTTSPKSLAKSVGFNYALTFLTNKSDLATLTFSLDHSSKPTFLKIDRAVALQETPLSGEEFQQIISLYEKPGSDKNLDLLTVYEIQTMELASQQNKWEKEREELKAQASEFENQKEKLLSDIKFSYDKIDDLQHQIIAKEKDCANLQKQLEKAPASDELNYAFADQSEYLQKLENFYAEKIDENNKLLEDLTNINEQKEKLQEACDKQEKEINEQEGINRAFKNDIKKLKDDIRKKEQIIRQKHLDIYSKARLLEKMKSEKIKDKEIRQTLKNDISLLKKEKLELEESIQTQRKNSDAIEEDLKKYENFFGEERAKVVHCKNELQGITAKLLADQAIYDALYQQVEAAQKYIYIADPFMTSQQFKNLLTNLETAMSHHPDLKVKLLYGMKARSGKDLEADLIASDDDYKKASKLELRLGKNAMTKRGNTLARVILFDDQSFILGSSNMMSSDENKPRANENTSTEIDESLSVEPLSNEVLSDEPANDDITNNEDANKNVALFSTDARICQQLKRQYFDW